MTKLLSAGRTLASISLRLLRTNQRPNVTYPLPLYLMQRNRSSGPLNSAQPRLEVRLKSDFQHEHIQLFFEQRSSIAPPLLIQLY
jgi:hypothetical protein